MTGRALVALAALTACLLTACGVRQQWYIDGDPTFYLAQSGHLLPYGRQCVRGHETLVQLQPVDAHFPKQMPATRFPFPSWDDCSMPTPEPRTIRIVGAPLFQITTPRGTVTFRRACDHGEPVVVQVPPINHRFAVRESAGFAILRDPDCTPSKARH